MLWLACLRLLRTGIWTDGLLRDNGIQAQEYGIQQDDKARQDVQVCEAAVYNSYGTLRWLMGLSL